MDIWDGLSSVRDETAVRASAGNDHAEVIFQIQETQRQVNTFDPTQIETNRLAIIVNASGISDNTTDISNLTTVVGNNTTDISNLTVVVGNNTTDITNLTTVVGNNTTDITNLTVVVGNNTTDITNLTLVVGTNTTDITNLTLVVGTNTSNISTNTSNISDLVDQITVELTNSDSVTITIGTPVYSSSGFKRAKADSSSTTKVIGLAFEDTSAAGSGRIQVTGVVTATTGEWDVVTGDSGGLTPNTLYYLSETTSGKLKTIAPTTGYIAPIGIAISTIQLRIEILNTVLL